METWVIPLWMVAIGAAMGLALLAVFYGVLRLVAPRAAEAIEEMALGGILQPLFYTALAPAVVGLITFAWAPWKERLIDQLAWPPGPDAAVALGTAGVVVGLFALYSLLRLFAPRVAAIAQTTTKEGLAQPLFWVGLSVGAFVLLVFIWIPYNTFGEDIKMLKDQGMTLIMVLSILLALWTASISVADEIEGRTALTLLSKPIGRRRFILGKFLGVLGPVLVMFFALGLVYLGTVSYKVVYEAAATGRTDQLLELCRSEMLSVLPGLALAFMSAMVLSAISVAISTRLPMLPNLLICLSIYALGYLIPTVVSAAGGNEFVQFVGLLLATLLPVLEHFNVTAAIAGGQPVPWDYVGMSFVYCLLYTAFALLAALVLFEDRDLA